MQGNGMDIIDGKTMGCALFGIGVLLVLVIGTVGGFGWLLWKALS